MFLTHYSLDALAAAMPAAMLQFTLLSFPLGVATYVNRPAPPHRPFQPAEMERARSYTVLEGPVLRHLERLRQLDRFGAYDLAVAWAALSTS